MLPTGPGKIAWIDPSDIAAVAAEALVRADLDGPLQLTGPEALDGDEVAARLGVQRIDLPLDKLARRRSWRRASTRGSRTRPCICSKRSRAARSRRRPTPSNVCSACCSAAVPGLSLRLAGL